MAGDLPSQKITFLLKPIHCSPGAGAGAWRGRSLKDDGIVGCANSQGLFFVVRGYCGGLTGHLESRKVDIAGITVHPNEQWMQQVARNATMDGCGALRDCRYLLHDRDAKYSASFRAIIETGRIKTLVLPARSPNLNAYAA